MTPASSQGVAQAGRRVCTDAWLWLPLSGRAARNAACTRLLGLGAVAVDSESPPTSRYREAQAWMTMGAPRLAQPCQRLWGQGDRPLLPALPATDVDQHTSAIHIGHLPMAPRLQAEPPGGDRGEAHAGARQSHAAEKLADLVAAEEHRQLFLARRSHQASGGSVTVEGLFEAELEAAQRHRARTAGVLRDMLDVEEVVAECFRSEQVW